MSSPDSQANGLDKTHTDGVAPSAPPAPAPAGPGARQFSPERIKELVDALEVPLDPSVIEWRVINTSKDKARGQVIPYADQRAYTDRLNALFTPAGWTRRYAVHTSANFQRSQDQKTVAKVFVTCDLTIFGIGSHSATGEEWADDENAGTSAEAQSFKRAAACFGLGRYLYYFTGLWVDLDERKRPKRRPELAGWATPQGWRQGLRPQQETARREVPDTAPAPSPNMDTQSGTASSAEHADLICRIESMAKPLGKRLYRGVLKTVARAWKPSEIADIALLRKVLTAMQTGNQMLDRLAGVLEQTGDGSLGKILRSLQLTSLEHVDSLEILEKIIHALETQ